MQQDRVRLPYAATALGVILLGLATRLLKRVADELGSALGDALYAALLYLLLVVAFPRLRPGHALVISTAVAWVVEVSQLWRPEWLEAVRRTTPGALALGGTFSVGDLWCYLAGTLTAFLVERFLMARCKT